VSVLSGPREMGSYRSKGSSQPDEFVEDGKTWKLQRHVSFVDCPGIDNVVTPCGKSASIMCTICV
jgi:translation initiation factor 2 subunit 3